MKYTGLDWISNKTAIFCADYDKEEWQFGGLSFIIV